MRLNIVARKSYQYNSMLESVIGRIEQFVREGLDE